MLKTVPVVILLLELPQDLYNFPFDVMVPLLTYCVLYLNISEHKNGKSCSQVLEQADR